MSIGLILKQIRKLKHISQKDIAEILNVSISSIYYRFENGGKISFDNYLKYCRYLEVFPYIPLIICNNDKLLLLYHKIYQSNLNKEMKDLILSILVQELSEVILQQIEQIFFKLDARIMDDEIKVI